MKPHDEYELTAIDGAPFSSGTDWECWQFSVCMGGGVGGCRCVNDDNVDDGGGCPLILMSAVGKTPVEWTGTTGTVIFRCTEKTTLAEQRAAAVAAEKARIAAQHYPLFEVP